MAATLFTGCAQPKGELFSQRGETRVWPKPPEPARIRFVGVLSGSDDLEAGKSGGEAFQAALRGNRRPIKFSSPHSLARKGPLLAVADVGVAGVHIVNLVERTHRLVTGWEDQRLGAPIGACFVGSRIFVTDAKRREVLEFDEAGDMRHRFGADVLDRPVGLAYVATRDQLYVVDGGTNDIVVFSPSGRLIRRIGRPGNDGGAFNRPTHIAWDGAERIAVADSANFRVQLLDLDGNFVGAIGRKGDAAGDFALPKGVAFDGDRHLYVVDAQFENVQVFNQNGALLIAFGQEGNTAGKFALPAGLAIDENNRIWVADSANHRIQVFDYLGNRS
ncbi:MAG: hypothetical protein H6817_03550 [Phycisphaerales bacterium]|nr:hypothetical protein [Phycisphaerales bacterium]